MLELKLLLNDKMSIYIPVYIIVIYFSFWDFESDWVPILYLNNLIDLLFLLKNLVCLYHI